MPWVDSFLNCDRNSLFLDTGELAKVRSAQRCVTIYEVTASSQFTGLQHPSTFRKGLIMAAIIIYVLIISPHYESGLVKHVSHQLASKTSASHAVFMQLCILVHFSTSEQMIP